MTGFITSIILSLYGHWFSPDGELLIRVSGIPSGDGKLLIGIYNKEEGFMDMTKTYRNITLDARKYQMQISIPDLPAGNYAIAVFHDANANGKLDKNMLGIPKEAYGFSNNARGSFGPPSYKDCLFTVGTDRKEISLKLR